MRNYDEKLRLCRQQVIGWALLSLKASITRAPYGLLHLFPGAGVTNCHKLGGLDNRNLFSHGSGGWKSEVKVSAELVPSESESVPGLPPSLRSLALLGLWVHHFTLCLHLHRAFLQGHQSY